MAEVDIRITDDKHRFTVGETVTGIAHMTVPFDIPLANINVSFHCLGEVKWVEYPGTPYYLNGYTYYDTISYHNETANWVEKDAKVEKHTDFKKVEIPFSFLIPKDKSLPSTMISAHGFIQYFVRVSIQNPSHSEPTKYIKEILVQSPMEENLLITVGGSAEKSVLLHSGKVSMHASIGRKGFYPGETITVHIAVDNQSSAKVLPRISLHQVQIFMCGARHKTIEATMSNEPIVGKEIEAHTYVKELLDVVIPSDESLTIKSSVITVKYFVHVTLDIPHAFDLHVNLPVVLTSKKVIEGLAEGKKNKTPEMISAQV